MQGSTSCWARRLFRMGACTLVKSRVNQKPLLHCLPYGRLTRCRFNRKHCLLGEAHPDGNTRVSYVQRDMPSRECYIQDADGLSS